MSCPLVELGISREKMYIQSACTGWHNESKLIEMCVFFDSCEKGASYLLTPRLAFSVGESLLKSSQIHDEDLTKEEKESLANNDLAHSVILLRNIGQNKKAEQIIKLLPDTKTPKEVKGEGYIG